MGPLLRRNGKHRFELSAPSYTLSLVKTRRGRTASPSPHFYIGKKKKADDESSALVRE
jgi:hypothetical protein